MADPTHASTGDEWVWVVLVAYAVLHALVVAIRDRKRTRHLRAIAPWYGLTHMSEDGSGLSNRSLARFLPGEARHVMVGSYDGKQVVACVAVREHDEQGDDHAWCVMVTLPRPVASCAVTAGRSKVRPCTDWPTRAWRRTRDHDPTYGRLVADAPMREWLASLERTYHFHCSGRWVACQTRLVWYSADREILRRQLASVVRTAVAFVDRIPAEVRAVGTPVERARRI